VGVLCGRLSPTPSDSMPQPATAPISTVVRPVLTNGACAQTRGSASLVEGGDSAGSWNIRLGARSDTVAIVVTADSRCQCAARLLQPPVRAGSVDVARAAWLLGRVVPVQ
jgi:hypothetical protein